MQQVTRKSLVSIINGVGGRFFSVTFTKRTTGEQRVMLARRGVKVGLVGGPLKYDPREKNLVMVVDVALYNKGVTCGVDPVDSARQSRRSIPLEAISSLRFGGEEYSVED